MTNYDKIEQIKQIIMELLANAGIEGSVEFEDSITKGLVFNISSPDSRLLIGRQGSHLHALETLVRAVAGKKMIGQEPLFFSLDVDDYKIKREWHLKEMLKSAVEEVKKTGRPLNLEPMPNYERRFVHAYLQDNYPEVTSISSGRDPYRYIVISIKKVT